MRIVAGALDNLQLCLGNSRGESDLMCITAIAVNVLVMEAMRNTVSSVTGLLDSISAKPCPWKYSTVPSRTTPTARPTVGQRLAISETLVLISALSTSHPPSRTSPEPMLLLGTGRQARRPV